MDERKHMSALPVICPDPNFDFPLQVISKLKGTKWSSPNESEEVDLGDVKVFRRKFEKFTAGYN